jgi:hypothetical protein
LTDSRVVSKGWWHSLANCSLHWLKTSCACSTWIFRVAGIFDL